MGMMKNLAISLEDGALDNPTLDDARREAWNHSLAGTEITNPYEGPVARAYFLGLLQFEVAMGELNNMRNRA